MYSAIAILLFLIIFSIDVVQPKCYHPPISGFPSSCTIGNLTVTSQSRIGLISNVSCNETTNITNLNAVPDIDFGDLRGVYLNRTFLLIAIDVTAKSPLWIVGNLSTNAAGVLIPPLRNSMPQIIYDYHRPHLNSSLPHEIDFVVFEENRINNSIARYSNDPLLHFNLSTWLEKQYQRGIVVCGPVGEGSLVVNSQFLIPVIPPPTNISRVTKSPTIKKNNAISNSLNCYILALVLVINFNSSIW